MKKCLCLALVLGCVSLVGCGEEIYDAAYYKENPTMATDVLIKCKSGDVSGDNCINAKKGIGMISAELLAAQMDRKENTRSLQFIEEYKKAKAVIDSK